MITLKAHQAEAVTRGVNMLRRNRILFLIFWMRKGKTLTSLSICDECLKETPNAKVLFISELKPLPSIQMDYLMMDNPSFEFVTVNYESVHKQLDKKYNIIIIDESHKIGQYAKPGVFAQRVKKICENKAVIYLSATPTPESGSQLYHQLWVSSYSPFAKWPTFYIWANEFVDITQDNIRGVPMNNYDKADFKKIMAYLAPISIVIGKDDGEEDGQLSEIDEQVIEINVSDQCADMYRQMKRDKIVYGPRGLVSVSNSGGELDGKLAQIASGTLRFAETIKGPCEPEAIVIDTSKADFIRSYFFGKKIAVIYRYVAEGDLLKKYFPNHTDDFVKFNASTDITYINQIRSARVGINLATADCIVMYNLEESSISYLQGIARGQSMQRKEVSKVVFIMSKLGIERKIYDSAKAKTSNTSVHYAK